MWKPTGSPGTLVVKAYKEPGEARCGSPQGARGLSLWEPTRSLGELVMGAHKEPRSPGELVVGTPQNPP